MIMLLNIKNYVDFRAFAKSLAGFMRSALAICAKTETEMFLSPLSIVCRYLLCKSQISENCSIVKFWPYNLNFTLKNYDFQVAGLGWDSFYNSVRLAFYTAIFGTIIIFVGSYLIEKLRINEGTRNVVQFFALMPMAVPGLVLGLAYIFFF